MNGRPYHDKPILHYWLVSAAYALGGVDAASARTVSALAMMLTVLAVYAWSATRWGVRSALGAAIVLATSLEFLALGRYASLDMTFTLWVTAGILAAERWSATFDRRWALAAGVAAGLGMLTKGLAAPLLIAGAAIGAAVGRGRGEPRQFMRGAAAALLGGGIVAGPWYALVALLDPNYLRIFLLQHHFGRFLGSARIALHPKPAWFYVPVLIGGFLPWTAALPAAGRDAWMRRDRSAGFCLLWAAAIFVFFSLSKGKLGTYILPCLPPLALVVGRYLASRFTTPPTDPTDARWLATGWWVVTGLALLVVPALLILRAMGISFVTVTTSLYGLVLLPPTWWAVRLLRDARPERVPLAVASVLLLGSVTFYAVVAPRVSAWTSDAHLVDALPNNTAPVLGYRIKPAALLFYLRRHVPVVMTPAQLTAALPADVPAFVVTSPKQAKDFIGLGLYPWRLGGRHLLYGTQPPPGGVTYVDGATRTP